MYAALEIDPNTNWLLSNQSWQFCYFPSNSLYLLNGKLDLFTSWFFIERNLLIPVIFYCSSWFNYYSLFSNAPLWIRVLLVYCVGLWWNPSCFIINYFHEIYFLQGTFKWHWIFCCLNVVFHKLFPAVLTSLSWNALNSL